MLTTKYNDFVNENKEFANTSEGKSFIQEVTKFIKESINNPELIKQLLKNSEYDVLLFNPLTIDERLKIKEFLEKLEIIDSLNKLDDRLYNPYNYIYVIMTKKGSCHDEFNLYEFGNNMIHEFFKDRYPEFISVSPIMTTDEFIDYINKTIKHRAKFMYSPKKFNREI